MNGANDNDLHVCAMTQTTHDEYLRLKQEFTRCGATAEQHCELDRVFAEQKRLAVGIACARVTASLRSLYDHLTIGGAA